MSRRGFVQCRWNGPLLLGSSSQECRSSPLAKRKSAVKYHVTSVLQRHRHRKITTFIYGSVFHPVSLVRGAPASCYSKMKHEGGGQGWTTKYFGAICVVPTNKLEQLGRRVPLFIDDTSCHGTEETISLLRNVHTEFLSRRTISSSDPSTSDRWMP